MNRCIRTISLGKLRWALKDRVRSRAFYLFRSPSHPLSPVLLFFLFSRQVERYPARAYLNMLSLVDCGFSLVVFLFVSWFFMCLFIHFVDIHSGLCYSGSSMLSQSLSLSHSVSHFPSALHLRKYMFKYLARP